MDDYLPYLTDEMDDLTLRKNDLPIVNYKKRIIDTVQTHQIVIIFGETGSGKTTQIPQYLLNAGINKGKVIGVTQPNESAVINKASRVCQERHGSLGMEVGYEIPYDKQFSNRTKIRFMTDGVLLNQCLTDVKLSEYGVIMIDEAHERSVDTDVLLGLLKMITLKRKDLKILISSATMDTVKFTDYFRGAPVIRVEGKMYDVQIIYCPTKSWPLNCIRDIIYKIRIQKVSGDVLIFLADQKEIEECCESLQVIGNLVVLPLYGGLGFEDQQRIFKPVEPGKRKVIVSTNIAETSITVDGIRFVIDSGYVKQNQYNPQTGIETLESVRISQSQADQRWGRAGRNNKGWCYRCYSAEEYLYMKKDRTPEIYRICLNRTYFKIAAIGLNPLTFPFIDSPEQLILQKCFKDLKDLNLINWRSEITELGKMMKYFPVEPRIGKVLITAYKLSCSVDILTILAMLSKENVFTYSQKTKELEEQKKKQFFDLDGDHFMLLNVFTKWSENNKTEQWCTENFVNFKKMQEVDLVRDRLISLMANHNMPLETSSDPNKKECIKKAFVSGFFKNICYLLSGRKYRNFDRGITVYMPRESCLVNIHPMLVLYDQIVNSTEPYMQGILVLSDSLLSEFPDEMKTINCNLLDFFDSLHNWGC